MPFLHQASVSIKLWSVHIPGIENTLADAISRNNLCLLYSQVPESIRQQTLIPPQIITLLLDQHLDWTLVNWTQQFSGCFGRLSFYYQKVRGKTVSYTLSAIQSIVPLPGIGSDAHTLLGAMAKNYLVAACYTQISLGLGNPETSIVPQLEYVV